MTGSLRGLGTGDVARGTPRVAIGQEDVATGVVGTDTHVDGGAGSKIGRVIIGTATVAVGTVTIGAGGYDAFTFFFFFVPIEMATGTEKHQDMRQQQISSIKRNHAHHGQPPPSEVVVVVHPPVTVTNPVHPLAPIHPIPSRLLAEDETFVQSPVTVPDRVPLNDAIVDILLENDISSSLRLDVSETHAAVVLDTNASPRVRRSMMFDCTEVKS